MSTYSFFERDVVERAAKSMLEHKQGSSNQGLPLELAVAIGWTEKSDSQIEAAFREALLKLRNA